MLCLVNNCWHLSDIKIYFLLLLVLEITHKMETLSLKKRYLEHCSILAIKKSSSLSVLGGMFVCISCSILTRISIRAPWDIGHLGKQYRNAGYLGKKLMGYGIFFKQIKRERAEKCLLFATGNKEIRNI